MRGRESIVETNIPILNNLHSQNNMRKKIIFTSSLQPPTIYYIINVKS